jgi:hypothetical protein
MSIASLGFSGIGAATPLAQSTGADTERAVQETSVQKSKLQSDLSAEQAAGVGQTDGDQHEIEQREGDGRQPWEFTAATQNPLPPDENPTDRPPPSSIDTTGQCGTLLDLIG